MADEWWRPPTHRLATLESDIDRGITYLCGRETPEGWEYAVVHWKLREAVLLALVRNGQVLYQAPTL